MWLRFRGFLPRHSWALNIYARYQSNRTWHHRVIGVYPGLDGVDTSPSATAKTVGEGQSWASSTLEGEITT